MSDSSTAADRQALAGDLLALRDLRQSAATYHKLATRIGNRRDEVAARISKTAQPGAYVLDGSVFLVSELDGIQIYPVSKLLVPDGRKIEAVGVPIGDNGPDAEAQL